MPHRFFIGRAAHLGRVRASTASNFKELVQRHLSVAVPLNVTREQYRAMDDEDRKTAKRVGYLVPAVFRESPSRRREDLVVHCNLLFVDLDQDPDGQYPASAFSRDPEALHRALHPFSFAAYLTTSSTPKRPRMRIVVDADEVPKERFADAVRTIFSMIGVQHVTKESLIPHQPMFLPSMFAGDDPEEHHPLLTYSVNGKAFRVDDITAVFKPEPQAASSVSMSALDFLRPSMPEITLEVAEEALGHIDPDIGYSDWLEIAAALRHQFSADSMREEAYALFDTWSSGGKKYTGSEDTRTKWDSLRPTPSGRKPVTVRSLLKRAVEHGWRHHGIKDKCITAVKLWAKSEATTITQLINDGIGKIATLPMMTPAEEDMLLNVLAQEAKSRFSSKVSITSLKRDLTRVKSEIRRAGAQEEKVPQWARDLVFISATNQIFRHATGERFSTEGANNLFGKHLLPTEAQLRESGAPVNTVTLSRPIVPPVQFLLNTVQIPSAYDHTYDPSDPDELFVVHDGVVKLNTFTRSHPEPDEETGMTAGNAVRRHLENLIAEPDYVRIVMDFLAFMVQNPGKKIRWGICLQGAQGCGKTMLADIMRAVLGSKHVKSVECSTIHTQYNDWILGAQFIVLEEIRVAGHNRWEVMNALKGVATNTHIQIHEKYRSPREERNTANIMALTNFRDAMPLDDNDRRWCIIQSKMQTKQQVLALGSDYFRKMYALISSMPGGLRWYFENWHISDAFDPSGHAPHTCYRDEFIRNSASEINVAAGEIIEQQSHPLIRHDLVSSRALRDLLADEGFNISVQALGKVLREMNYTHRGRFHLGDLDRHNLWTKMGEYTGPDAVDEEARWRIKHRKFLDIL